MSNQDNFPEENTSTSSTTHSDEFGREAWYKARWKSHKEVLSQALWYQSLRFMRIAAASHEKLVPYLDFNSENHIKLTKPIDSDFSKGFTVEVWVLFDNPPISSFHIIEFGDAEGKNNIQFTYERKSQELCFKVSDGGDGKRNVSSIVASYIPEVRRWRHLAATVDEDGTAVLYVNGRQLKSGNVKRPSRTKREFHYIGRHLPSAASNSRFGIRELRLWKTARTEQQIMGDMRMAQIEGNEKSDLVGYWPFDEGRGDIIGDHSNSYHHGELYPNNAQTSSWRPTSETTLREYYVAHKLLEASEIVRGLFEFFTECFEFFHDGFYQRANGSDGSGAQSSRGNESILGTNQGKDTKSKINELEERIKGAFGDWAKVLYGTTVYGTTDRDKLANQLQSYKDSLLFTSKKYSPHFVLSSLVEQSSYDLNLLQQIYAQRAFGDDEKRELEFFVGELGELNVDTFLMAEELGSRALRAASGKLLDRRYHSVLCVLGSRTAVRLLPYHDSVLLSVPYSTNVPYTTNQVSQTTTNAPPLTLTAIPHEIGHVVYRFGQFPLVKGNKLPIHRLLRNRLLAKPHELKADDWRFQWLEEIFADAYGCLVAGPIAVLGFQIMLADGPPQHLNRHLGKHPFPVLRPLLQSQILRSMRTQFGNPIFSEAPTLLDARWQNWVADNWPQWVAEKWLGYTDQTDIIRNALFDVAGKTLKGQEILDELEPLIEVVLQTLDTVRPQSKESTWTPNWVPATDTEQLANLHEQFSIFTRERAKEARTKMQEELQADKDALRDRQPKLDLFQRIKDKGLDGWQDRSLGIDGLIEMILFEGWSEEGPETVNEQ